MTKLFWIFLISTLFCTINLQANNLLKASDLSMSDNTALAYAAYFILLAAIIFAIVLLVRKRRHKLQEHMLEEHKLKEAKLKEEEIRQSEQKRKEEIYEAKLDLLTNIAHELCTPLTLIYGSCSRILEQKNISLSATKYAGVINQSAKQMNSLISNLMEFKQMESGYRQPQISLLNISEIADKIVDLFNINSSGSKISFKKQYDTGITWNSDENFLLTTLTNLISNAVKYSSKGKAIKVNIAIEDESLKIAVVNSGKGMGKEVIDTIFDRYTILNNREQNDWQNGLGLAVTAGLVELLQGKIDVDSILGKTTTFSVTLPQMLETSTTNIGYRPLANTAQIEALVPVTSYEYIDNRPSVAVIDHDTEMLWFICDLLNDNFNVVPVNDPAQAIDILSGKQTDIILCNAGMPKVDGIALTKILKSDKAMSHIPLIVISAVHEMEKQIEAIDAGAEMYITKPFNTEYLKSTIRRLLGYKEEDLKEHFVASPLSALEPNVGNLQHSDHIKFLKKVHNTINKNSHRKSLSPSLIAKQLGMSNSNLYRKLKEATDVGLQEMIHQARLASAENLLLKSQFTVDDIIFKSGFTNRAVFYRVFSKKHECSPSEFRERNGI